MNHITNEQRLQINEFFYSNAYSVQIVHLALLEDNIEVFIREILTKMLERLCQN